jgi:hypothetical protein
MPTLGNTFTTSISSPQLVQGGVPSSLKERVTSKRLPHDLQRNS